MAVFGRLFSGQVPPFHAIAMYRQRDYERAGLHTLPSRRGFAIARRDIVLYLAVQVAISLTLWPLGVVGVGYLAVAAALGIVVLAQAIPGPKSGEATWARGVFRRPLSYLPPPFTTLARAGRP